MQDKDFAIEDEDFAIEDEDFAMPVDDAPSAGPSFSLGASRSSVDPGYDEDEWDAQSTFSDASTDIFVDDNEHDVVPPSFTLPTQSTNEELFEDSELLHLPSPPEEAQLPSSTVVYGSDSKHLLSLRSHDALLTQTAAELCYDWPLSEFGYALNEEAKAVICIGCHRGVPLDMLQTHSKNHHRGRSLLSSEEQAKVVQSLSSMGYQTSNTDRYHQLPGQKPVDGLEVLTGFTCPLLNPDRTRCSKAFLAQSTFTRHLSNHPDRPKPQPSTCTSEIQTLFHQGNLQGYFSVDSSLSNLDPSASSAYTYAVRMLPNLPKPHIAASSHDKDRASIHWFTRWPDLLRRYVTDRSSLAFFQSLVSFPEPGSDPDWLMKLREHGGRWWNHSELAHVKCSYRASVTLRSHQK
jgi:hypothetical protein